MDTNVPLLVHADAQLIDADATTLPTDTRMALFRCGAADSKPFCDGGPSAVEFETG